VYKAKSKATGELVALKRIRMETEKEGVSKLCEIFDCFESCKYLHLFTQFPITAMREIKLLQKLRHKRIVQLTEIMVSKGNSSHQGENV
jgi:CTD kinase subunit alpha